MVAPSGASQKLAAHPLKPRLVLSAGLAGGSTSPSREAYGPHGPEPPGGPLSQSALSRLIGRLEQHGLVQRSLCDADRRGIYVCLTEDGRRRHAEALPTQRAVLAATLGSGAAGR